MEPDAVELRVLGCLLEKQRTTPDAYPLTLNALRLACNQTTNRDPVLDLDEQSIRQALDRLGHRRWTRLASGPGSRAPKFRHLLDDALGLATDELALLCVLMLRGPQTLGELKTRTERLHAFASLDEVATVLGRLAERELAATARRPGWKETRWVQRLGGTGAALETHDGGEDVHVAPPVAEAPASGPAVPDRLQAVEDELAALRDEVALLRGQIRALQGG